MNKSILLAILALVIWSFAGCSGPGEPTNRLDEFRQASGQQPPENDPPPRNDPPADPPDDEESDDKETDDSGKSGEDPAEPPAEDVDEDDKESAEEAEERARAEEKAAADERARTAFRPNRPPDLRASGGGGGGGAARDGEDDFKKLTPPKEQPRETSPPPPNNSNSGIAEEQPEPEERRWTLFERANFAFSTRNEPEAFQYLYAHTIAEEDAPDAHPHAWYAGISEPRVGLRWGVAVDYDARKFEGDPPKFDSEAPAGGANANSGGGGMDIGDRLPSGFGAPRGQTPSSNAPSGDDPEEQLDYYTGDFGELFIQRIEMRRTHADEYYGASLADADNSYVIEGGNHAGRPGNQGPGGRETPGFSAGGGGLISDDGAPPTRTPPSGSSGTPPGSSGNSGSGKTVEGFEPEFTASPNSLTPGVMMLGVGSVRDMLEKARSQGLDLLAVFDVSVSVSSRDEAKNATMLTVYDVKSGEKLVSTRRLNHLAYAKAIEDGRPNQIEEELDSVFQEGVDKTHKSEALPELTSDVAQRRIENLLKQEHSNPLPVLAEIRQYFALDLISQADFVAAAEALIGGENARKLVDGDVEEREAALKKWLPGQFTFESGDSEFR
jgi:hypothetical protein